ncbi:hypothetical protein ACROYT_G003898 [Oculina patagonica]
MESFFVARGYPVQLVREGRRKAASTPRTLLLAEKNTNQTATNRVPMVTTYHPKNTPVSNILSRNHNILADDDSTKLIFSQPPLKAYRRAKNLRDLLVHCDFQTQPEQEPDIDECKETPYVCGDESNTCKNSIGSYDCICNKTGFEYKREARECFDTDECLNNPCGNKNMDCHNSQGSYSCECKSHYRRDGNVCKDIDECADKNTRLCEGDMKCINTPGSYNCECDHGYFLDADRQCKDRDECKIRTHNCSKQSYCRNSPGSFKCVCPKGYEGNAITKCSPNRRTRFTTPKYLLKDLKRGAWDTILVVLCASAIGIALLIIIILMLKKMCIKCANCRKKKELAYQDQLFYPAEMYDPDQMFFPGVGHEQMFYPDQMGYKGDEMFYPEGYPEGMDYPEETGYSDEEYYDEVAKPIPMASVDPTLSVPHTYYGDDQDDEPYYDYAEGVPYEEY